MTTKIRCSKNSSCVETKMSDFHKITVFPLKMEIHILASRVVSQRYYKTFSNGSFIHSLRSNITENDVYYDEKCFEKLCEICVKF